MRLRFLLFILISITFSCNSELPPEVEQETKPNIYIPYSTLENTYEHFNSPMAINAIAAIENEYFNAYQDDVSAYYGTVWEISASASSPDKGSPSTFDAFKQILPDTTCPTPLHCTIYANKALQAGLGDSWQKLSELHQKQWGKREYAGWSIAYLLCKHFDWQAYLFIREDSPEYDVCKKAFQRHQKYPVYNQPDIPLEAMFELGKDDPQIEALLAAHEFGWGFSYQGWHTWISRFKDLKKCYWGGAPSQKMAAPGALPLFLKTPFLQYQDYGSHVICFPRKKGT